MERHSRSILFKPIGAEGQRRIERARVTVVGAGALGSQISESLVRAGVGRESGMVRIIDRDYVDLTNLQRQTLFVESDAAEAAPKASAAARHLRAIDEHARVEPMVRDLNPANAARLIAGSDLVIDGTDNFATRFLINDAAIDAGLPWIYGAAVGSRGMVATIVPGRTPCLRCYLRDVPGMGPADSCDTAGIITPLPTLVASLEVAAALRWIVEGALDRGLMSLDLWTSPPSFRRIFESAEPDRECASCGTRELPALRGDSGELVTLCGRNSVQIADGRDADLDAIEARLRPVYPLHRHPESVSADISEGRLTVFADGRMIVEGTTDPLRAKSIVARYLG
jgi:adenylyltransferase/sulfurtransferase